MQPATRFGHFHDCCRRQPIMFCQLSLRVGSDPGRQEGDVDFVEHPLTWSRPFFWPCPHLWSHSFPPDLPSPHVWLLPGGEISLDTPLSYPVVASASGLNPFRSTLVWHLVASGATDYHPLSQTLSPPYYSWCRGRMEEERLNLPTHFF